VRLVIKRWYEPAPPGKQYHSPYRTHVLLELSDEERDLVARYGLGEHVLTTSQHSITTLADVLQGKHGIVGAIDVAMNNEQVLRDACASLPGIFDYCRSLGHELSVEIF